MITAIKVSKNIGYSPYVFALEPFCRPSHPAKFIIADKKRPVNNIKNGPQFNEERFIF